MRALCKELGALSCTCFASIQMNNGSTNTDKQQYMGNMLPKAQIT